MKGSLLWIVLASLTAGCVPLALAPDHIAPRALERRGLTELPPAEEVSTRITQRRRALPETFESRKVKWGGARTVELVQVAGRLSDALRAEVVIEERGTAQEGQNAPPEAPAPISVSGAHTVGQVLREIALRTDYEWEWEEGAGTGPGRLILYRDPLRPPAEVPAAGWGESEEWRIDPVRHRTLRGVLQEWTARAGWTLVWEAKEVDYAVRAPAVYLGTFDSAVDALLRETKDQRILVPTLWRANRYLTVREAG